MEALTRDKRWEGWYDSHLHFEDWASRIKFHDGVPDDVVKRFELVEKLILHSYYEYEFVDLASERALTAFEMALLIRYEQMTGRKPNITLEKLIGWGAQQGLFDKSENFIQPLRELRNMAAHPRQWTLLGFPASIEIALRVVEVINFMFPKQ